jgi:hypothetical protein
MALGHFPVPTGCRNRDFCPSKFVGGSGGAAELFLKILPILLGFSVERLLIGEGASSVVDQGGLSIGGRGQGLGRAPLWCGQPLAPLRLPFGPRPPSGKNRSFRTCFIQFREYFLCSFSETQKQQKIGNWHCGILSIG